MYVFSGKTFGNWSHSIKDIYLLFCPAATQLAHYSKGKTIIIESFFCFFFFWFNKWRRCALIAAVQWLVHLRLTAVTLLTEHYGFTAWSSALLLTTELWNGYTYMYYINLQLTYSKTSTGLKFRVEWAGNSCLGVDW